MWMIRAPSLLSGCPLLGGSGSRGGVGGGGWRVEAPALAVQPDQLAADGELLLQPVRRDAAALGTDATSRDVGRGNFLVRTMVRTVFPISIRASVQTRMAVGQVAVFRSVRNIFLHASKIVSYAHFIGTCTLARFGSARLGERRVLTRAVGVPGFLEVAPTVALPMRQPRRMDRCRDDAERL